MLTKLKLMKYINLFKRKVYQNFYDTPFYNVKFFKNITKLEILSN